VTDDFPDGTFTDAGTPATATFELVRFTMTPVLEAGPVRVIVPATAVDELPLTVTGFTEIELNTGADILSGAC